MRLEFALQHAILVVSLALFFGLLLGASMAESFDPYYTWLGIPPEEQPADHYRLLGVRRFEANEEVIINASDQRMSYIRTFQTGKRSKESQALLNELSAAQVCLLNADKKRAYDEGLRRKLGQNSTNQPAARPVEAQPAARPAPVPARTLPVASPLRPSATPSQPLTPAQMLPAAQRRTPVATADPLSLLELDPLASAQIAANPLRPVVAPKNSAFTPRMLIVAGPAAAALVVLLGIVVWAATRPGSTPLAKVPTGDNDSSPAAPAGAVPRPPVPSSTTASAVPANPSATAAPTETPRPEDPAPSAPTSTAGSGGGQPVPVENTRSVTPTPSPTPSEPPATAPTPASPVADNISDPGPRGFTPAAMAAAQSALKSVGVSLPEDPLQVYSIQTRGSEVTGEHAAHLAAFPNLQHLNLQGTAAAPAVLKQLATLSHVTTLNLQETPVTDDDLAHLSKFPRIKHLNLEQTQVKGPGLAHLKHVPLLTGIGLPGGLARDSVPHICQLKALEGCDFPPGMTDDDLKLVGELTRLKGLWLGQAKITSEGLRHLQNLKQLDSIGLPPEMPPEALGHLVTLNLQMYYFPANSGDRELVHFAGMQRLERVNPPQQMTDEGMKVLSTYPALRNVNLSVCPNITDTGMLEMCRCATLREIDLPMRVTDAGVVPLCMLPELEAVNMDRAKLITPRAIAALVPATKLKSVRIGDIATAECAAQLQRLPKLEILGVFYDGPANAEFVRGLKDLKQLKSLNFAQVTFDDESIEALHGLSGLESLMIQHHKLPEDKLSVLQKTLSKCRITNF
jgi:hypothetical protein